jgi:pyruvate/2-oxoacid:ferredoxin oxidoreductase alpha subunit
MSTETTRIALTGNQAVAMAARLARVQVIAAYPITPQTSIVEELAECCARGELAAQFLHTESEHSSMAACIGASMTGARAFTATSSQGLALMHEMLHWAAGARAPVVMGEVNRSLAAPWTILTDQSDTMAQRDTGWMQFYCGSNQEVLDTVILAYKVAEQVLLPAMVVLDAFVLSHCVEPVETIPPEVVDAYLPARTAPLKLDPAAPHAFGGMMFPDCFMEQRFKIQQSMEIADEVIATEADALASLTARRLEALHTYRLEDAEHVVLCLGTAFGAVQEAVDALRQEGVRAGGIRMWQYRPFPAQALRRAIRPGTRLAVIDRACSFGMGGPVASEVMASLDGHDVYGFVAGLGGREIRPETIAGVFRALVEGRAERHRIQWVEVRA